MDSTHSNSLVSVIIPTYNRAHLIGETVESALAQTYKHLEILVVDDGSTDNTQEILQPYKDHIRYFYQENRGVSAARNVGLRNAQGRYIAFLDSDDLWLHEKTERQLQFFADHPECGLIYTDYARQVEREGEVSIREHSNKSAYSGYIFPQLLLHNFVFGGGSTVMIRRECIETVGYFNENLRTVEDYELWLRISKRYKVGYIDEVLALYRFHGSNKSQNFVPHTTAKIQVLEDILTRFPEARLEAGKRLVNRRLHSFYYDLGYHFFDTQDYNEARKYLTQSIRLVPTHIASYLYLAATFLHPTMICRMRGVKRKTRGALRNAGAPHHKAPKVQ
jgi:glycosyltransferase involved in cell wall biosynthesis